MTRTAFLTFFFLALYALFPVSKMVSAQSTARVSVRSDGAAGNMTSSASFITSNGRFVVFKSSASNLVDNDTNGVTDIFVHDRDTDNDGTFDEAGFIKTVRVSVHSDGTAGNFTSASPFVTSDGRYVVYQSNATNLVDTDTNGVTDIFVHDRDTDNDGNFDENGLISTIRVSISSDEAVGNAISSSAYIVPGGRYVVFQSDASNLVTGDTNGVTDIFVHDRDTDDDGTFDETGYISTVRASVRSDGAAGNGNSASPYITSDGRYVVFESTAANLIANDTNGVKDVFVGDLEADSGSGDSGNNNGDDENGGGGGGCFIGSMMVLLFDLWR